MRFQVALTAEASSISSAHLLQHYQSDSLQEDLCFALWRPSTGTERYTALIDHVILPEDGERLLHGNASFQPDYLVRVMRLAKKKEAGVAFMHSHPSSGWQDMSGADIQAERDVLAYPAGSTGLPLVGMTLGSDGYWSSRFWQRDGDQMRRHWCEKTRVIGARNYEIYSNDNVVPVPQRRRILRRTYDTWGLDSQAKISRLRVGIVGLGSVGCIVAETMARIGVTEVILIDPDHVEEHNLDRLLYGTVNDIGKLKVDLAAAAMSHNATADAMRISTLPKSIHDREAYRAALDCDVIFSCVDRPIPRDVLNYIAQAHLIPVVDGGVAVEADEARDSLFSAHWRAHMVTPYHRCLRCCGQYSSSDVVMELDGSLDDPSYVSSLPSSDRRRNQNVFPFSLSVAGMEVNLLIRYILSSAWWPIVRQQDYQFVTAEMRVFNDECHPNCTFRDRRARGDLEEPFYLSEPSDLPPPSSWRRSYSRIVRLLGRVFSRA